jgi:hypothetical protein
MCNRPIRVPALQEPSFELKAFKEFERAFLARPHQPRIPRHIGGEDRRETAGLAHGVSPNARRRPDSNSSRCSAFR